MPAIYIVFINIDESNLVLNVEQLKSEQNKKKKARDEKYNWNLWISNRHLKTSSTNIFIGFWKFKARLRLP